MSCPLCRQRKGKRACPAKGADICSHCCGTKRLVEIACPSDCVYLKGAHAPGWEGRRTEQERDARRLAPHLSGLTEAQGQLVLLALAGLAAIRSRRPGLDDSLVLEAVSTLRKTVETREKGILYEHPTPDARAQGLAHELAALFEARGADGAVRAPADRDLLAALRAFEAALRATRREGSAPRAFLDTATRLAGRLGGPLPTRTEPLILAP